MGTSNKNSCKTAAVMSLLNRGGGVEHIQAAEPPSPRDIETITGEILEAQETGGEAILTIGRGLIEAKAVLSHGEWLDWLENRVEIKRRGAQRLMQLAQTYSNASALTHLGQTKALMLAVLSEDERDTFISEPHQVNGEEKMVIDMTSRELEAVMKERDKALAAAERARVEQTAAEAARDKMSADMKAANERIAGLNAEVEQRTAEAQKAASAAAQLEKDLEELRSRPVEVAVEVDSAAVEAARKETEKKMQAKLEEAKKAQAKAEEARKAAEDAAAAAQQKVEQAQAEAQAIREQAAKAEKQTALASDEDLVVARMLFDQVQELVNKLSGVLMKLRNKKPDAAAGLSRALLALADRVREVAQG